MKGINETNEKQTKNKQKTSNRENNMKNSNSSSIESLTYEECLQKVDLLLTKLQNDNIPIEEVQGYYKEGKDYLDHCEKLLNSIEQEIVQLDIEAIGND